MGRQPAPLRSPKARRTGTVSCGHLVIQGNRIYKEAGGKWICQACQAERVRQAQAQDGDGG
jgi:hypothetical protein